MPSKIRMVLLTPEATRKALKIEAARQEVDMSDLATLALDGVLDLMAEGKTPAWLADAIKQFKQSRDADDVAEDVNRGRSRRKAED